MPSLLFSNDGLHGSVRLISTLALFSLKGGRGESTRPKLSVAALCRRDKNVSPRQ